MLTAHIATAGIMTRGVTRSATFRVIRARRLTSASKYAFAVSKERCAPSHHRARLLSGFSGVVHTSGCGVVVAEEGFTPTSSSESSIAGRRRVRASSLLALVPAGPAKFEKIDKNTFALLSLP